jgi:hypothetical protein
MNHPEKIAETLAGFIRGPKTGNITARVATVDFMKFIFKF